MAGVIENYLHRGLALLMARRLSLFKMTVEAPSIRGHSVKHPVPNDTEIACWLMEATKIHKGVDGVVIPYVFPIPGCPLMRPEPGFIEFVSSPDSTPFFLF